MKTQQLHGLGLFRVRHHFAGLLFMSAASVAMAPGAYATGTLAGTDIENIATASYDTGAGTVEVLSNPVVITVDELLDVTLTNTDPGSVTVANGAQNTVLTYRITNTGNGPEAYRLTPDVAVGGDDFDPSLVQIVLDTNNNNVYDPGVDTVYVSGSNDPVLTPDQGINVFVISNVPATQSNGDQADIRLTAAAVTGTGAPGTSFNGAGEGGGDAVVGSTSADAEDTGTLLVEAATVTLTKTATVLDPFGGSASVPGAIVTYTLVASVTGSGTLANMVIADPIPTGTTYVTASTTLEAAALTDAADADAGNFNGSRISVALGGVPAGQTRTVTFRTRIQ